MDGDTCVKCGDVLKDERWPCGRGEVCQICWEAICSQAWWKALEANQ